jgi:hypothetical protein
MVWQPFVIEFFLRKKFVGVFMGQKGVHGKFLVVCESIDAIFNLREHCQLGVKLREIFFTSP